MAIGDLKITEEKEDPFVKIEFPGKKALSSVVNVDEATKIIAALVKACRYAKSDADRTPTKLLDDSAVKNLNENKNKSPKRRIDTIDARAVLNAAEWPKGGQQRGNPPSAALP
ncbi:MAG: hypothetical protein CR217_04960 [Beijerinckiaceae bacterium]|nr:MAG: hypothetical protein CR217_04960 [Beijerinckiaceae bacterium]